MILFLITIFVLNANLIPLIIFYLLLLLFFYNCEIIFEKGREAINKLIKMNIFRQYFFN